MISDPHLVPLKPEPFRDFACPRCGHDRPQASSCVFPGIHVMGRFACRGCGLEFLRDFPVGFGVDHPMAIGTNDGSLFNLNGGDGWIHGPLIAGYLAPHTGPVAIERIMHREARRVVILNTLDFLYGHVLLKLFNAQHYLDRHPDLGLVLILPKSFAWLVPKGTAEVWLVDQKLSQAHRWSTAIDAFVQQQLPRFEEVYLGRGYAHPEFTSIDIERFTGLAPFDPAGYLERPPHITFIARRDRLWFASGLEKFLCRALNKIGAKAVARSFASRQDQLMRRTMRAIRERLPEARFTVAGLGPPGGFGELADDLRTDRMDQGTEMAWCAAYARSQLVVGVHGSNMILPTAFSCGCIEILPYDRYGNMVQDLSVRWNDRMQLFHYRFVDEFASPRAVARHVVSMFADYAVYHRDNRVNIFPSNP